MEHSKLMMPLFYGGNFNRDGRRMRTVLDTVDQAALTPVMLHYEDAVKLILSWFDGRTFAEQGPYELLERCHQAAWREKDHQANFEQKKNDVIRRRAKLNH